MPASSNCANAIARHVGVPHRRVPAGEPWHHCYLALLSADAVMALVREARPNAIETVVAGTASGPGAERLTRQIQYQRYPYRRSPPDLAARRRGGTRLAFLTFLQ